MKKFIITTPSNKKIVCRHKRKLNILPHINIFLAVLFVLLPLYIMIVTSLMTSRESQQSAFHWWPENGFHIDAYKKLFSMRLGNTSFLKAFSNTMLMYLPSTLVGILMSSMAAYGFAKVKFLGSKFLYSAVIILMTFPSNLTIVIQFLIFDKIGWTNTPLPVMVPRMLGSFGVVFFLTQYYRGIPNDLVGTAKLDGLGDWGIFFRVMLPISVPVFFAQFILQFISAYNDYMGPLLYLTDDRFYTMSLLLAKFGDNAYTQEWNMKMAGCVVGMTPLVILYCCSQGFILKGMEITSGLKG